MTEFAEIRSALAELQRSPGGIEGTLGGLTKGFEEFRTDHSKLAGRVLLTELSIAQSRGPNTILGAVGGGLMSAIGGDGVEAVDVKSARQPQMPASSARNATGRIAFASMVYQHIRHELTRLGVWTAHPLAFSVVLIYAIGWFIFDRATFDLHGVATLATWLMTLFIQRAEHRDTQGMQAKLDELLYAHRNARNDLADIDKQDAEEIEGHRARTNGGH